MAQITKKARIQRLNGKLYDMKTPNKSFLQVALDLKTLKIDNWMFMLEIKDPEVLKIDPYAVDKDGHTTLTADQAQRVISECYRNPWYYLREICRIPDPGGSSVPYKANRGNIAQAWCIWKGIDSWLCLPRQQGKTISSIAFQCWMYQFGTTNSTFIYLNKDGDGAKANLKRLTDQIDKLPEYMRFSSITSDEDGKIIKERRSATRIEHPINKNCIIVKPKATSYESAINIARGLTSPIMYFDEPEFMNEIKTIIENSVSTFSTAAERAKANNAMYARIFTCTPGDLGTKPGEQAQMILSRTIKWTEKMYNMTDAEIEQFMDSQGEDCNRIVYIQYTYLQIGKDEAWFRKQSAQIGNPIVVRRELLLQRLKASSDSPYSQEDMEYIAQSEQAPIKEIWVQSFYKFDVYEELTRKIPYLIGIDVASGNGGEGDNHAITLINPYTVKPAAEFECNYISIPALSRLIVEFVSKYVPKACIAIERNNAGIALTQLLLESKIKDRLYYDRGRDMLEQQMKAAENVKSMLQKQAAMNRTYGVWTDPKSRAIMFSILANRVADNKEDFVTHNIIRDMSYLVRSGGNDKVQAAPGFHDDSIMSYLIAMYVYKHGNNLQRFGITPGELSPEEKNTGMFRPADTIDPSLVDPELIEQVKKQEQLSSMPSYEAMLKRAMLEAQKESIKFKQKGLVSNPAFDDINMEDLPYEMIPTYEDDDEESLDLSMFNSLNGF